MTLGTEGFPSEGIRGIFGSAFGLDSLTLPSQGGESLNLGASPLSRGGAPSFPPLRNPTPLRTLVARFLTPLTSVLYSGAVNPKTGRARRNGNPNPGEISTEPGRSGLRLVGVLEPQLYTLACTDARSQELSFGRVGSNPQDIPAASRKAPPTRRRFLYRP